MVTIEAVLPRGGKPSISALLCVPVRPARFVSCDQVLQPRQKHVSCAWVDLELSFLSCRCELQLMLLLHEMDTLGAETVFNKHR